MDMELLEWLRCNFKWKHKHIYVHILVVSFIGWLEINYIKENCDYFGDLQRQNSTAVGKTPVHQDTVMEPTWWDFLKL